MQIKCDIDIQKSFSFYLWLLSIIKIGHFLILKKKSIFTKTLLSCIKITIIKIESVIDS